MYDVDPERDAHIGRSMNLFASGFYHPPVAPSLPMAIETIKQETSSELEDLKRGQARIMMISMFLPQQVRSAPKFIHNHDFLFEGFHCKYWFYDFSVLMQEACLAPIQKQSWRR